MFYANLEGDVINNFIQVRIDDVTLNNKRIEFTIIAKEKEIKNETVDLTDEYIEANWRNFIITSSSTPNQDDDAVLEKEYGDYLYAKHSY
jgi:hypothetical protein